MLDLTHGGTCREDRVDTDADERQDALELSQIRACPQQADQIHGKLFTGAGGLNERFNESPDRLAVARSVIALKATSVYAQYLCLRLDFFYDAFNVFTDDAGSAAREHGDEGGVKLIIQFNDRTFEFLSGAKNDVFFIHAGRIDVGRLVTPHAQYVVDMINAAFRTVDQNDAVSNVADRLYGAKELTRGARNLSCTLEQTCHSRCTLVLHVPNSSYKYRTSLRVTQQHRSYHEQLLATPCASCAVLEDPFQPPSVLEVVLEALDTRERRRQTTSLKKPLLPIHDLITGRVPRFAFFIAKQLNFEKFKCEESFKPVIYRN